MERIKHKTETVFNEYGKIPPQAIDAETKILGACMIERDVNDVAISILKPDYFYKEAHQHIFKAISDLYNESNPVDIITVTNRLRTNEKLDEVGGPFYITDLTSKIASGANTEFHCRIVQQKHISREIIRISSQAIKDAYDDNEDVFQLQSRAINEFSSLINDSSVKHISMVVDQAKTEFEMRSKDGVISGINSPLKTLNNITGGFRNKELIIIGARPSMGKTSFVLYHMIEWAKQGIAGLIFSIEMSDVGLVNRVMSSEEGFFKGTTDPDKLIYINRKFDEIKKLPIYIDDKGSTNMNYIASVAKKQKRINDIKYVVVDYMQLINPDNDKDIIEQQVAKISRKCKLIAKELNIPFFALSQLSRENTKRTNARPILADLRYSGAIEQDADVILFLHREDYYSVGGKTENGNDAAGVMEVLVRKNRNYQIGTSEHRHNDTHTEYYDIVHDEF